jgi:flagellar basal-body rod protein FlgG
MINALNTAATGMAAQAKQIEVISNNVANADTVGFKKSRADFQDLLYQNVKDPGAATSATTQSPTGIQVGLGTQLVGVSRENAQGSLRPTGRPLDLAVGGNGYLAFAKPNGEIGYSRDGNLQLNNEGVVVNAQGFPLTPEVRIPPNSQSITISPDGRVQVRVGNAGNDIQDAGQIQLVGFANPSGLRAEGNNLFVETSASGVATPGTPNEGGLGVIQQNYLETSNVQAMTEMTDMIRSQRLYELNSKVVTTSDQMMSTLNQIR